MNESRGAADGIPNVRLQSHWDQLICLIAKSVPKALSAQREMLDQRNLG